MDIATALIIFNRKKGSPQGIITTNIVVSGAGVEAANGTYVLQGGTGTERYWKNANNFVISYHEDGEINLWAITVDTFLFYRGGVTGGDPVSSSGAWYYESVEDAPAPTLTWKINTGTDYSMELIVRNAGVTAANGTYALQNGVGTSRVWSNGTYGIAWSTTENAWALYAESNPTIGLYVAGDSATYICGQGQWTYPVGTSPGPYVGYSSFRSSCNVVFSNENCNLAPVEDAGVGWTGTSTDPYGGEAWVWSLNYSARNGKWVLSISGGFSNVSSSPVCEDNIPPWALEWLYNDIVVTEIL